jgi:PPM family protein phosphatase
MRTAVRTVASAGHGGDDRVLVLPWHDGVAIVVADGAGGTGGGGLAADAAIASLRATLERPGPPSLTGALASADAQITALAHGGQTTAAVATLSGGRIVGASVGDSEAWLLANKTSTVLTEHQVRKPLLGSGIARPVSFHATCSAGTLLLGSDGLFKYTSAAKIRAVAAGPDLEVAADELLALVRLRSGVYQDDVAVVLCRW